MAIIRGEIYFVELGPTRGREIDAKRRPAVVLSIDAINRKPLVVTVVPGTTRAPGKPVYLNEVRVQPTATNGLTNPTVFLCFQLKALDHSRFDQPAVGVLSANELKEIEDTVRFCLGLQ
jgi:mRNA interferase MazF